MFGKRIEGVDSDCGLQAFRRDRLVRPAGDPGFRDLALPVVLEVFDEHASGSSAPQKSPQASGDQAAQVAARPGAARGAAKQATQYFTESAAARIAGIPAAASLSSLKSSS
jgi:hypothetical protein